MYKQNFHLRETAPKRFLYRLAATTLFLLVLLIFIPFVPEIKLASATIDIEDYDITLATADTVNLNVQPTINDGVAAVKNTVIASTNSPAGYKLYLSTNADLDENIYLDGDESNNTADKKFAPTNGTYEEPGTLNKNSWGYAVAGLGNFDASYDNASAISKFAKTPVYGSEQLIHTHVGTADNDVTEVYYAAKAGIDLASGSYATEILYTIMTEASSEIQGEATISPSELMSDYTATTATITTSLNTSRELGNVTVLVGDSTCADVEIIENNPVTLTCDLPLNLNPGEYDVEINFAKLGKNYTITDGLKINHRPVIVTLNADGGELTNSTIELPINAAIGDLPTPNLAGHIFDGWYTQPNGGGTKISAATSITSNVTFYANYYSVCLFHNGDSWNFNYTGGEQTFNIPAGCEGLYKLEVWGGKGGNGRYYDGGNGGYAMGYYAANDAALLYIVAGGAGENGGKETGTSTKRGGYNGGGNAVYRTASGDEGDHKNGAGGGATHIALVSGTLASIGYDSFVTNGNGLIVAGGGGGASDFEDPYYVEIVNQWTTRTDHQGAGGAGGGLNGGAGQVFDAEIDNIGGSQTVGYAFGVGESTDNTTYNAAGGAGFYGGYAKLYSYWNCAGGGGGGSSWYGGVPTITFKNTTYSPSTTAGANNGNGKAKITLVDLKYAPYVATISWNANDGSASPIIATNTDNRGIVLNTIPSPMPRDGFKFLGWATSPTATTPDIINVRGTFTPNSITYFDNITYYAIWQEVVCEYSNGKTWDFAYTGEVQSWTVPEGCDGVYRLEVYGAQGSLGPRQSENKRTYGGYASGYKLFDAGQTIYITVGGAGTDFSGSTYPRTLAGGYNGGGNGSHESDRVGGGAGGGATHMAYVSGTLASIGYNSFVTAGNGLIVAGGGGGSLYYWGEDYKGGNGGGSAGGDSTDTYNSDYRDKSLGGKQVPDTMSANPGSFGVGASSRAGGGGGFYGGASSWADVTAGAGGSGWTGGVANFKYGETTYSSSMSSGTNSGNGKARITLIKR